MRRIELNLERHAEAYEDALDDALEAFRETEFEYAGSVTLIEELRAALRLASVPKAAA